MLFSIKVKCSGLPPQNLDTQKFHLFIVVLFCNCFGIQWLGQLGQAGQAISGVWPNVFARILTNSILHKTMHIKC